MNEPTMETLARRMDKGHQGDMTFRVLCVLGIAICLVAVVTGCESYEERTKRETIARQEKERREEAKRKEIVAHLREAHNADDEWDKGSFFWTADIQDRIIRSDGRPIVGIARLHDVERLGKSHIIHLRHRIGFFPLEFVLECERPSRPKDISTSSLIFGWGYSEYAFVAKIRRVKKQDVVRVRGSEGRTFDTSPRWIAEGECLALREIIYEETGQAPPPRAR